MRNDKKWGMGYFKKVQVRNFRNTQGDFFTQRQSSKVFTAPNGICHV